MPNIQANKLCLEGSEIQEFKGNCILIEAKCKKKIIKLTKMALISSISCADLNYKRNFFK